LTKTTSLSVFIFYTISAGNQSALSFSKEFKHCNIITFDGEDWILVEFDKTGLLTRKIKCKNGYKLVKNLKVVPEISAIVSISVDKRAVTRWKPWIVRSCNEICRYASGADIGFTFNPIHLYRKLLRYNHVKNYEVLSAWRRSHGILRR